MTEAFGPEKGLRQGHAMSTTLFNFVLEVIRNTETNPNGKCLTERDSIQHMQMIC